MFLRAVNLTVPARLVLDYLTRRGFVRVAAHAVAPIHNEMADVEQADDEAGQGSETPEVFA